MAALVTRMRIVRTMTDRTLVLAKMVLLEMEQLVLVNYILHTCCMCLVYNSASVCLFVCLFVYLFVWLVGWLMAVGLVVFVPYPL